ncbi:hypothetical protein C5167_024773 [Papaver somniferum]|uniref:Uncharacterized protein n=1 Tax=Papaver somniferum TaxID=3469 RepID=A0A4Y7JTK9_PAPSO|nr:hypothetical protein C5167_024773 [Papaver somniferum]
MGSRGKFFSRAIPIANPTSTDVVLDFSLRVFHSTKNSSLQFDDIKKLKAPPPSSKSAKYVGFVKIFLAGVLAWKDTQVLVPALQIDEILMDKLPGTFSKMFVREGMVHAVETLIVYDSSSSALQESPASWIINAFSAL